jgi:hypothetical protein
MQQGEGAAASRFREENLEDMDREARAESRGAYGKEESRGRRKERWWEIGLGRGMYWDIKRRAPYYLSDWTDAWNYRVVPSTLVSVLAVCGYMSADRPSLSFSQMWVFHAGFLGGGLTNADLTGSGFLARPYRLFFLLLTSAES